MCINVLVCVTINELEKNEDRDWRSVSGILSWLLLVRIV